MNKKMNKFKSIATFFLVGLILIGLANPALGDVSVSINTDKNSYYLGDAVKFTVVINITNEDTCTINQPKLSIHGGSSIVCDLPATSMSNVVYGNCNLSMTLYANTDDCFGYSSASTVYRYSFEWKMPQNWSTGLNYAGANVIFESNNYSSETSFFVVNILAGDPVELMKFADTSDTGIDDIIHYTVIVRNNDTQPLNVSLNDTADNNLRFVGNVTVNCNCSEYGYNATPWVFTTNPQERAADWWVNLAGLPPNCTCTLKTTAKVINTIGSVIINKVTAISDNETNAVIDRANVTVKFKVIPTPPPLPPKKTGGGFPQGAATIEPVKVTIEQKILTDIPDIITPKTQCFNVKSLRNKFEDGILVETTEKNLTNITVVLYLPDETQTLIKTDENGNVCFDFVCGNYTINITQKNFEEYVKSFTAYYGKLSITPADLTGVNTGETLTYVIKDNDKNSVSEVFVNVTLPAGKELNFITKSDGKVAFNTGTEEGNYVVFAWKYCYANDTLTGVIKKPVVCGDGLCGKDENCSNCESDCGACYIPKLMINCTNYIEAGGIIVCSVSDESGKSVSYASVTLTDGRSAKTGGDGKVKFTANQPGTIDANAVKGGYVDSEKTRISVSEKGCFLFNISFLSICWYWWLILILILILIVLIFGKKKESQ